MADPAVLYRSTAGYRAVMASYDAALAHCPPPVETTFIPTRFGDTHVIATGQPDGPPVVYFHGWNGNGAGVGRTLNFLCEKYRLIIPDIIGHSGRSAPTRPRPAGSSYADWAADLLQGLGLGPVPVIGISGGGWLTLKLAAYYPALVGRAIVLNSDGLAPLNPRFLLHFLPAVLHPTERTARWLMRGLVPGEDPDGELYKAFIRSMLPVLRHFKPQRNPGRLPDTELRRIKAPLLALMGEHDLFWPRQAVQRARRLIPGLVAAEILPNVGHVFLDRQLPHLARRVLRFLQEEIDPNTELS